MVAAKLGLEGGEEEAVASGPSFEWLCFKCLLFLFCTETDAKTYC